MPTDFIPFETAEGKIQLTEVKARVLCIGRDNGRTPGSSWNNAGQPVDLIRYQHAFESCGVEIGDGNGGITLAGEGQLIGPTTGWTPQFTDNTANDGKGVPADGSALSLETWVGYLNSIHDSRKYCTAFGVAPARTWRYARTCTIDPCAKFGLWTLKWLDATDEQIANGENIFYIGIPEELVEEEIICRAYCDRKDKSTGAVVRDWYAQELNSEGEFEWVPAEQPTWQPSRTAEPVPIPNDCWIPKSEKFGDWRVEGAESPCTTIIRELCDQLPDNSVVNVTLFITDCDGVRTTELYTDEQINTSTDPLDPDGDQYQVQGDLLNRDKSAFVEPPIIVVEPTELEKLCEIQDELEEQTTLLECLKSLWEKDPIEPREACDFTAEFKSAGLDAIVTDKGTITITPPNNDFSSTTGSSPEMVAAQAEIQAFLDANGGGTVSLSYPSDSILKIEISGTTCMFETATDNSNEGPHQFAKGTVIGPPEEHNAETNQFDPDRGIRWDAWIQNGSTYTIQASAGPGSEGWVNTWANGNDQQIGTAYFALARIAVYDGPPGSSPNEKSDGYILIAPNQLTGNGGSPSTATYDPTIPPVWSAGDVTCTDEQMLGMLIAQGFTQAEATELVTTGTTLGLSLPSGQCWTNGDFSGQPFGLWGVGA